MSGRDFTSMSITSRWGGGFLPRGKMPIVADGLNQLLESNQLLHLPTITYSRL